MGNSVMTPAVVIGRTVLAVISVNHRMPSGPAAIPVGPLCLAGRGNSVMTPAVVIRPTLLAPISVNHRFPSGPAVIPVGLLLGLGIGNRRYLLSAGIARAGVAATRASPVMI